jgi:SpoVK/Ycf46/Vps4 family AAA+-type ATPase
MSLEDPGSVSFAGIGGLGDQVRELREVIELPLMNPELFEVSGSSRLHVIDGSFVCLVVVPPRALWSPLAWPPG